MEHVTQITLASLSSVQWGLIAAAVGAVLLTLLIAAVANRRKRRQARRAILKAQPFPAEWEQILQETIPLYRRLPAELQTELHGHIQVFLAEKRFEGCDGLEITDTIRVTIAAQACVLLLGRPATYYPKLTTIFVYPKAYVARNQAGAGGIVADQVRGGESWTGGDVAIAWDHALAGAANVHDGNDVTLHEFAHQLDQEDGSADGAPILESRSCYATWAEVLGSEFQTLQDRAQRGRKSFLNKYGATHPAEFFAVATEAFFEKPKHLKRKKPELYEQLADYYHVDPVTWKDPDKK